MMYSNVARIHQPPQLTSTIYPQYNYGDGTDYLVQAFQQQQGRRSSHTTSQSPHHSTQKHSQLSHVSQPYQSSTPAQNARPVAQPNRGDGGEHMLRRKTPNGTLSAGYDGTPVEWNARPSANKHILMSGPASTNKTYSPTVGGIGNTASFSQRINHHDRDKWRAGRESRNTGQQQWNGYGNPMEAQQLLIQPWWAGQPPSLDSVLHQAPPAQFYGGYQQVPTVLQPVWSPSVIPTASNAQGPFGPYWPNGAFEPYRPAPVRDSRFNAQFANISLNDPLDMQLAHDARDWQNNGAIHSPRGQYMQQRGFRNEDDLSLGSATNKHHLVGGTMAPNTLQSDNFKAQWEAPAQSLSRAPSSHQGEGSSWPSHNSSKQYTSLGLTIDADETNANFRDKTLVWAHKVYVNLLSSMQQARRNSQPKHHPRSHPTERRHSQPTYLPKPPQYTSSKACANTNQKQKKENSALVLSSTKNLHPNNEIDNGTHDNVNGNFGGHFPKTQGNFYERVFRTPQPSNLQADNLHRQQMANMFSPSLYQYPIFNQPQVPSPLSEAQSAFEALKRLVVDNGWHWVDGMLLGGCLAYGLGDHKTAHMWYSAVLKCAPDHVEALSNLAATCTILHAPKDAEHHWRRAIDLRPHYFEAIEHLVGLLCQDGRPAEAVEILKKMESRLKPVEQEMMPPPPWEILSRSTTSHLTDMSNFDADQYMKTLSMSIDAPVTSGYNIAPCENGRFIALIHAKGNMLYSLGDNVGASRAFEEAVMVAAGKSSSGIAGLIKHILQVFAKALLIHKGPKDAQLASCETILLPPNMALKTAELAFPGGGMLPGLREVPDGPAKRAAVSVASNSLLSLAKIYQDGMSSSPSNSSGSSRATPGVQDILALYYLSLSLQPSPSTANNVGILLAGIQQSVPQKSAAAMQDPEILNIPGVVPGSGISLALAYYNYGLRLDSRHAHLYTNLGSLLKDIGQLNAAIRMYEQAVSCDGNFDIALANLANAVKDQGRISDAIGFYRRAVTANPEFSEAVCGLANALNSVCCWSGRGGVLFSDKKFDRWHVDDKGMLMDAKQIGAATTGWIGRVVAIVEKQLKDGESWGRGILQTREGQELFPSNHELSGQEQGIKKAMIEWLNSAGHQWEGARVVRLVERATKRLTWQIYQERHVKKQNPNPRMYGRPPLPSSLAIPSAPTVLPFHTFTCPLTAEQIRKISQRNGLRISCSTLKAPWLPSTVFEPPSPPAPQLNIGYVSSDFNNHPLAHLMQSVFGFHDSSKVKAFCYATTASDNSSHRQQIQKEAPVFYDASSWSLDKLVKQILDDNIHILINLNGYTRGARNEVFAARPAPIQMSFMGFAGTLGAEWCDYILADTTAIPPSTLRPNRRNVDLIDLTKDNNFGGEETDWVYGENIIYARDTFFCCDHRQSAPDSQEVQLNWADEQERRRSMRKELFPNLSDNIVILGNFNQLYKIEPTTFRTWLRILQNVPNAVLWLLRFPDLGEQNLRQIAQQWASPDVASRIIFTDVAPKHQHIARARVCDLFLDTPECNAHTTAADVLWSGTPLLTFPRYDFKMCSRMAASILKGALPKGEEGRLAAADLIVSSEAEYEQRAIQLGNGLAAVLKGEAKESRLLNLRKILYEGRWTSALFDTRRWVRDLEEAYGIAWDRYVAGDGGDIWL